MDNFESEFQTYCDTYGKPDRIELMLCDINAVMRGKWLPASDVSKLTSGSVRPYQYPHMLQIFLETKWLKLV